MIPRILARRGLHTTARARALTKFMMPAMSPTMTEGGIASWKVKEGEGFAAGDVLLEIETDKATMDVEAQDDGILAKIIKSDGSKAVQVGTVIAITAEEGDDLSGADKMAGEAESESPKKLEEEGTEGAKPDQSAAAAPPPPPPKEEKPAPPKEEKKPEPKAETQEFEKGVIFASPIAKRMALERGIPLGQVKGTGPNGRIIKVDIEGFKPSTAAAAAPAPSAGKATSAAPSPPPADVDYIDIPLSSMRRTIGKRLLEAKQSVPHYYLTVDVQMDKVMKLREVFNTAAAAQKDAQAGKAGKLSVNDFIVKACALALSEVPEANSSWMGESIRQYKRADISIAVATPNGLITPIVKDCGAKGLATISAETKVLAGKARDGKLQPQEYQGGTFTISNLGMFDIKVFSAIINPPQSCILAVGSTTPTLVPAPEEERGFKVVQVMQATLSADHRTVDGAVGARWLAAFKRYLENPLTFML